MMSEYGDEPTPSVPWIQNLLIYSSICMPIMNQNKISESINLLMMIWQALEMTCFKKSHLHRLNQLFGLLEWVQVPVDQMGDHAYRFHWEELLLFSFTKIALGASNQCHAM
jgi:hypothetical protein